MKKTLFLFCLLFAPFLVAQPAVDQYRAVQSVTCPNTAPSDWNMQKTTIGATLRWVFCDPLDHVFAKRGVYYITGDGNTEANHVPVSFNSALTNKYGAIDAFNLAYARILGWGFNSGAPGAFRHATNSEVVTANKVPFTEYMQQGANVHLSCITTDQCKNLWNLTTVAYANNLYLVDAYDPAFATYANAKYLIDDSLNAYKASPYFMGIVAGDTDFFSGFSGACPTAPSHPFDTDPSGSCWASPMISGHGGIALSAPRQIVNPANSYAVFTDSKNYTKYAYAAFLKSRYTTITALNTAWGTAYATGGANNTDGFGTDGTQVSNVATSGASSGPYTVTLHTSVDPFSVLIKVSGVSIGGDDGHGVLHGTNISSGTINYATGAVSITFTGTPGAAPTITYFWGGYTYGAGVLDESGTHIGNGDTTGAPGATSGQITNQVTDLDDFLTAYTVQLFTVMKSAYTAAISPNLKLFFGISSFGQVPGRDPSRCSILKGAGQVLDVTQVSTDGSSAQATFITNCLGDHPWTNWETITAEVDSDWYNCPSGTGCSGAPTSWPPNNWNLPVQSQRGLFFQSDMSNLWGNSTGWVGYDWWAYAEFSFFEHVNFGLVSWRDNAYDGVEDVTGSVACSSPISAFVCGGEQFTYGNFLGPVTTANFGIDSLLASTPASNPPTLTPTSFAFTALVSQSQSQTFVLSNATASNLTITSQAVTGASFSLTSGSSTCVAAMVLTPTAQCTLVVAFTPTAATSYSGSLSVVTSAGTLSSTLTGTGTVSGSVTLTPATAFVYPNTVVGASASTTFVLLNGMNVSATVSSRAVTGTSFALSGSSTCTTSLVLAPNDSCTLIATFTPSSGATFVGNLNVVTTQGTFNRSLTGTGLVTGSVSLLPNTFTFSNTLVGNSASTNFVLNNGMNVNVTVSSQSVSGTSFSLNSGSSTCFATLVLAPNAQCTLQVTFNPASAASFSGTLTAVTTSGTVASSLSGTGFTVAPTAGKGKGHKTKGALQIKH